MSFKTGNQNTNKTVKSFEEMTEKQLMLKAAKAHLTYARLKKRATRKSYLLKK
jgi:hypothetical protein